MDGTTLRVGHSPDSDDAFMFYALTHDRLPDAGGLRFVHQLEDIETLNQRAMKGELEISAVSLHAYAHIADRYALLASGCSMGDRYGPILVTRDHDSIEALAGKEIAIPGPLTTAALALKLCLGKNVPTKVMPFDKILPAVLDGSIEAGVIIHEGQLTYEAQGARKLVDLGEWWYSQTGLPLPLGGNVVRRDLGEETIAKVARLLRESIQYALDHRDEALGYALKYAPDLDTPTANRFVGMYVNDWTVDYGPVGRQAVRELMRRGHEAGLLLADPVDVQFVG